MEQATTRRALFGVTAGTVALAAVATRNPTLMLGKSKVYPDNGPSEDDDWVGFFNTMAFLHPNGRAVAHKAYKGGWKLADLTMIELEGPPRLRPQLHFRGDGDTSATVVGMQTGLVL